ncbi:ArsR/SmtB family transcription factor [Halalkalicoccus subterraneus]|uniref:ArsR/SmtB family transcription factor n=1 Tax=Halalkalicoccus subterraneus TaxID=2675002 RepID=UPI000EFC8E88|nr:helix-turn-helix domain-containing protein [Halalkalicoccus subterraneus]
MTQFGHNVDSEPVADLKAGIDPQSPPEQESVKKNTKERMLPADAFALLGNDTRIDILQALLDANADKTPVGFTELFERVDIADSANFNYHLQKLTDHFIKRTEDGYEFRHPGRKVVSSIFAGTLTDRAELGFFSVNGSCHTCEGNLHGWYVDEVLTVACVDCSTVLVSYPFPPGGLEERTSEELLQAFHHYVRHHYCMAADGVCPECTGTVETELVNESDENSNFDLIVEHSCQRCGYSLQSSVGVNLLDNAEVLLFHSQRGIDLSTEPFWHFEWCVSNTRTTILSDDPLQIRVDIPCAGDELRVVLDETLSVTETAIQEQLSS